MEHTARLFNCARCHCQRVICSGCDHGNIYCSKACSQEARRESLREAGARYQASHLGKRRHAERQKRYRERKKEKVTHHTSPLSTAHSQCPEKPMEVNHSPDKPMRCHFCHQTVSVFLRNGFLNQQNTVKATTFLKN